jgi:hypothetical protein
MKIWKYLKNWRYLRDSLAKKKKISVRGLKQRLNI